MKCNYCNGEVVDGFCDFCHLEYSRPKLSDLIGVCIHNLKARWNWFKLKRRFNGEETFRRRKTSKE